MIIINGLKIINGFNKFAILGKSLLLFSRINVLGIEFDLKIII